MPFKSVLFNLVGALWFGASGVRELGRRRRLVSHAKGVHCHPARHLSQYNRDLRTRRNTGLLKPVPIVI